MDIKIMLNNLNENEKNEFIKYLNDISEINVKISSMNDITEKEYRNRGEMSILQDVIITFISAGGATALWELFKFWVDQRPKAKLTINISNDKSIELSNISLSDLKKILKA